MSDLSVGMVHDIFQMGIVCNWWRSQGRLIQNEVPDRLTEQNLDLHRHSFEKFDPRYGKPFRENTPFISTTAGTVERDVIEETNTLLPAWKSALYFATEGWTKDGWLFYAYLFLIGKPAVKLEAFSEELRDINIYTGYSPYLTEGEITAKLVIPTAQIERADFWSLADFRTGLDNERLPAPNKSLKNKFFVQPKDYSNIRNLIA